MSIWRDRTSWTKTWLDVETVGTVTGLKPDTIYHYVSRKEPKFPQPSTERGRNYFSGDQVFNYVLAHKPKRHNRVPRLYPRTPEPAPAQFVSATRVRLPAVGNFAVHTWQPADGGPPIAIAYPDRENTMLGHDADDAAEALLTHLPPHIAAVAVPNAETTLRIGPDGRQEDEPTIVVAERDPVHRRDPVGQRSSRYRWSDLANLLRVDIPWWTPLLNDLDAMLTWRPGAATARITPYTPNLDTGHITTLGRPDDPPELRHALDKLAARILRRINGTTIDDGHRLTPGLVQAAESTVDITTPPPTLTPDESATILEHRAGEHAAKHALRVADHRAFLPVLTHVIRIEPTTTHPMAHKWATRLIDVSPERRTELGFWFVNSYLGSNVRPARWLTDPDSEPSWIIEADNGVIYAGIGTAAPRAVGELAAVEIADHAAFFRDGKGRIWPLPDAGFDYYSTGYEGGGPQRLAETLTTLLRDASSDVSEPPDLRDTVNSARYKALRELVTSRHAPLTVTADWVNEQRGSTRLASP
ncbi:hypothetical protein [Mycolicibacterium mageritense]|uniref:hypothetical protein n=1 Tax=Mycolicibacterium mageritense TaxID=53462 RepID=UPI0011DC4B4B|nr:hypothetical protein [Mycolicibacterium mageritense]TXI56462.1 MAG: hypothetical protein E6Q55_28770 [Mycolicibacterium mageritense]